MKVIGEVVKEGRPTAERTVREWQESHPTGKKADCIRETGLAKHTVYKWWKDIIFQKAHLLSVASIGVRHCTERKYRRD